MISFHRYMTATRARRGVTVASTQRSLTGWFRTIESVVSQVLKSGSGAPRLITHSTWPTIFPAILRVRRMKRTLQLVALAVAVLLAAQPALAGLPCAMGTPACGPCAACCHGHMSQMGMGCSMPDQMAGTACDQNCCQVGLPQVVAQLAAGAKPKAGRTEYVAATPMMVADAGPAFSAPPPVPYIAAAPARYILFQVFRI